MNWLTRLFTRKQPNPSVDPEPLPQLEAHPPDEPPEWAVDLLEAVQKVGRAQARSIARLESLESKLEAGFTDVRSAVSAARPTAEPPKLDAVLDALDILDEARRSLLDAGFSQSEQGLAGVTERLEGFLRRSGVARRAQVSEPIDGKLFRVVGTVERSDLPDGAPAQVVRAAALAGDRVVREGEVLVNRRPSA